MLSRLAPAKINLFLHVVGQFEDGYHELQTVFQLLDWCDELEFETTRDGSINRAVPLPGIAEQSDITIRTARHLRRKFPGPQGVVIRCRKHLPVGAGLGGGSSNAATTLLALNELWELGLDLAQLAEIGVQIGADVPVFVYGKNAWAQGRGEVLSDISIPEQLFVIVYPACQVSTKRVFEAFRGQGYREKCSLESIEALPGSNDLEATTCRLYPEVHRAVEWMRDWGKPRMTGTGSAVFMPIENHQVGEKIMAKLPSAWTGRICLGRGS